MKNVFVLVHDDSGQEARLQAALDVVRAVGGHLSCIDVIQVPILVGDVYGFGGQAQLIELERDREAQNRARIEARLIREGVSWSWIDAIGDMAPTMTSLSDLADIIVLNRKLEAAQAPDMQGITAAVMLGSHKPILAVPDSSRGCNLGGHAVVAWDGSTEAASALRAAVPLLRLAERVTIVEVEDGKVRAPATEAAVYLSRYDVHAEIAGVSAGKSVDAVLNDQCRSLKADYLVMGGYGHTRVTEALFGGITRKLLTNCPVPLLLAH
mgnify:CR=1 FL=1|jgi:nucleotide-binding universal stress UspA family protein